MVGQVCPAVDAAVGAVAVGQVGLEGLGARHGNREQRYGCGGGGGRGGGRAKTTEEETTVTEERGGTRCVTGLHLDKHMNTDPHTRC